MFAKTYSTERGYQRYMRHCERAAESYVEPELNNEQNAAVIFIWFLCAVVPFAMLGFAPGSWPIAPLIGSLMAAYFYFVAWNKQKDDPRIAEAKRKYAIARKFWEIAK